MGNLLDISFPSTNKQIHPGEKPYVYKQCGEEYSHCSHVLRCQRTQNGDKLCI